MYDADYEEHLCSYLSDLYEAPLELVGVWHKHNRLGSSPVPSLDRKHPTAFGRTRYRTLSSPRKT